MWKPAWECTELALYNKIWKHLIMMSRLSAKVRLFFPFVGCFAFSLLYVHVRTFPLACCFRFRPRPPRCGCPWMVTKGQTEHALDPDGLVHSLTHEPFSFCPRRKARSLLHHTLRLYVSRQRSHTLHCMLLEHVSVSSVLYKILSILTGTLSGCLCLPNKARTSN